MRLKDPDPPTRAKILAAGEALMLAKGFAGTTVDDVCSSASVTKGSFFHYFESKEALAKSLLDGFAQRQAARLFGDGATGAPAPLDRLHAFIDGMIEAAKEPTTKGCLLGTIAQETVETHPELCQLCGELFGGFVSRVTELLAAARDSEGAAARFDPEELSRYLLALIQGSLLVRKATGDTRVLERNLVQFRGYLTHLLGKRTRAHDGS